jgi:hypothetical protein
MSSENTQLTTASGYDTKRMIFSDPQAGSIPNSVPQINYKRITIQTKNPDGTIGDLILSTSKLFSFGVSENANPETGKVNGYVMPICLWNRDKDSVTKEEKDFTDAFDAIIEKCKEHLVAHREEIEQYDLALSDLKKFNPLWWKREKGKIVDGTGPTLYAKLITSKKQDKIVTMFYDANGDTVDPLSLNGKYCYVNAAVKFESVFIGNKISMQIKLYECEVRLADTGMKRLMKRPTAQPRVLNATSFLPLNSHESKELQSDGEGSVKDDDDIQISTPSLPPTKPKPVVKRNIKKVIRKGAGDENEE